MDALLLSSAVVATAQIRTSLQFVSSCGSRAIVFDHESASKLSDGEDELPFCFGIVCPAFKGFEDAIGVQRRRSLSRTDTHETAVERRDET